MIIANPIYDTVFKRLMADDRVAKFFIGTLLNETVEHLHVQPQEYTYHQELVGVKVMRLDYVATLRTVEGGQKKVLIEIQKAQNLVDLMRFRNYLGEQYKKEDEWEGIKTALPITTMYILGFKLPEIETACLKVARQYIDLVSGNTVQAKSAFVERLTHDAYLVQVGRIGDRYASRLDKLLSVFQQDFFIDEKRISKAYPHTPDLEEVKTMTTILEHTSANAEQRKNIEDELEAHRFLDVQFGEQNRMLVEQARQLAEKDEIIAALQRKLGEQE